MRCQRQLDEAQRQLQTANQALASRTPQRLRAHSTAALGGDPWFANTGDSGGILCGSVTEFRKKLDGALKDFRVESCPRHSVQAPTELYRFTSPISLLFDNGRKNFTTDHPGEGRCDRQMALPTVKR